MVLKISRSRKRKKSTLWLWLLLIFLLLIIIAVVLYFILAGKKTPSGPGQGPSGPTPSGPPGPSGPPPGPTPKDDLTDCLALNYYGSKGGKPAPQKICGVFDGFSHWSWAGMQQWLAYFSWKTGAKHVVIYEAQFIPESWLSEVKVKIIKPEKGNKNPAQMLPKTCKNDAQCQGTVKNGTLSPPGANWRCTENGAQMGVCYDQCLTKSVQCSATLNKGCSEYYLKTLNCPADAYCGGNNYCHYNSPHGESANYPCNYDSNKPTVCICKGTKGDWCDKKTSTLR